MAEAEPIRSVDFERFQAPQPKPHEQLQPFPDEQVKPLLAKGMILQRRKQANYRRFIGR